MIIYVKIKNVYGNELVYPDCEKSAVFASLANSKSLTPKTLQYIEKLGYAIKIRPRLEFYSEVIDNLVTIKG